MDRALTFGVLVGFWVPFLGHLVACLGTWVGLFHAGLVPTIVAYGLLAGSSVAMGSLPGLRRLLSLVSWIICWSSFGYPEGSGESFGGWYAQDPFLLG